MIAAKMSKAEIKEIFGDEDYPLPKVWLKAENPAYQHHPSDNQTVVVWGVVTFNLKRMCNRS
jgi:DNA polymerase V